MPCSKVVVSPSGGGGEGPECTGPSDCPDGYTCESGECVEDGGEGGDGGNGGGGGGEGGQEPVDTSTLLYVAALASGALAVRAAIWGDG